MNRFNKTNSALRLKSGYLKVPSGVYFYGDFSIMGWVKAYTLAQLARLIDFGNGASNDNIVFSISQTTNGPFFWHYLVAQLKLKLIAILY